MITLEELLKHVETQARMADEHRCDAIERESYGAEITYWAGRQAAWEDAADLIRHYLKGENDES